MLILNSQVICNPKDIFFDIFNVNELVNRIKCVLKISILENKSKLDMSSVYYTFTYRTTELWFGIPHVFQIFRVYYSLFFLLCS